MTPRKKTADQTEEPAFVDGVKILLRPLCEVDLNDRYLSWLNDGEVTRFMETGTFPVTARELQEFYENTAKSKTDVLFAIVDKETDLHIGNIKLGGINWVHRFADLGIMIGDKPYWGKGYGREACSLLLKYAFETLNLNKVTLGVYGNHAAAIKAYEKVGFQIEGRISGLLNFEGRYVDKVILGISRQQFTGGREKSQGDNEA